MSEVKWIKIMTDIFSDDKILLIEALPSADSIIVIWFKLLCLAGQMNNEGVFIMNNRIAYTDEMLASIFRRDVNTVRLALEVFRQYGMIEVIDDVITIPNWNKHQTLDSYEAKKARDRKYQRERRAKQKALIGLSDDCQTTESSYVAISEEEKEEEIEIDNNRYIVGQDPTPYKEITEYLNSKIGANYRHTTRKTQDLIKARMNEGFTVDDFKTVIDKMSAEWLTDEKMHTYLRPETLFGNKFESYLNRPDKLERNPELTQERRDLYNAITL